MDNPINATGEAVIENHTLESVVSLPTDTKELIGFSLISKLNGKIVSASMRAAHADLTTPQVGSDGIDAYNDALARMEAAAAGSDFLDNAGIEQVVRDPREELRAYLFVHSILSDDPVYGDYASKRPVFENFKFILGRAASADAGSEEEMQKVSKASGLSLEEVKQSFAKTHAREFARTEERVLRAIEIITEVGTPIEGETVAFDSDRTDIPEIDPSVFDTMVSESFDAGRKSAVKLANNTEDAIASLVLLKASEG